MDVVIWCRSPETLPDAELHLFERSGHQPFVEEPERFAAAVENFFAGARPYRQQTE